MAPTWAGPGLFRFTQAIRNKFGELGGVTLQRSNAANKNGFHIFMFYPVYHLLKLKMATSS